MRERRGFFSKLMVCLAIFFYLTQVPAVYWPLFGGLLLYVVHSTFNKDRRVGLSLPVSARTALLLFACFCLFFFLRLSATQTAVDLAKLTVESVYPIVVFMAFSFWITRGRKRVAIRAIIGTLSASLAFYTFELLFPTPALEYHAFLYPKSLLPLAEAGFVFAGPYSLFWASGLSPHLHLFGYQLTAALVFGIIGTAYSARHRAWYVVLVCVATAVAIVAAQRSVFAAVLPSLGLAILGRIFLGTSSWKPKWIALSLLLVASCVYGLIVYRDRLFDPNLKLVQERLDPDNIQTRIGMQKAAIEIILEHPFGLAATGDEEPAWGILAGEKGYAVAIDPATSQYALVHNSFLRFPLQLGWLGGLIAGAILALVVRASFRLLSIARSRPRDPASKYQIMLSGCVLSLLVQALFHNDSFFTFEPISWLTLCGLLAEVEMSRRMTTRQESLEHIASPASDALRVAIH